MLSDVVLEFDRELPSRDCKFHNRVYMEACAVDERERGVLLIEGQCKIGSSKHDCLRALLLE